MRNERLVLRTIFSSEGISQSEVAKLTGLKPPTVLRLFSSLAHQGFIEPCEKNSVPDDRKGRRPVYYRTRPEALYAVGIELWSNSIAVTVIDFRGRPVVSFLSAAEEPHTPETVVPALSSVFRTALGRCGAEEPNLLGVGVGCPGWIDEENGVIRIWSEAEALTGFGLRDALEAELGLDVRLLSAAPSAAFWHISDSGWTKESLVMVILREGVEGAFIIRSSDSGTNQAVRLSPGDLPTEGPGRADGLPIWRNLNENRLLERLSEGDDILSIEKLDEYLSGNKGTIQEILSDDTTIFARMMLTVVQILNPERIVVSMRSRTLSELFAGAVNTLIKSWCNASGRPGPTVLSTVYRDGTVARAAADLIMEEFFSSECP